MNYVDTTSLHRALRIAKKIVTLLPHGTMIDSEGLARHLTDLDVRIGTDTMPFVVRCLFRHGFLLKTSTYVNANRPEARGRPLRVWKVV